MPVLHIQGTRSEKAETRFLQHSAVVISVLNVVIPLCLSIIKVHNYQSTQLFIVNYAFTA